MKRLSARIGRCVNRVFERSGKVLDGRYHHRLLRTPREVRHALAYVLLNARHHFYERYGKRPPAVRLDPASSAGGFEGWRWCCGSRSAFDGRDLEIAPTGGIAPSSEIAPTPEVATPRTWLLRTGWRRHRLIDPAEVPGLR